jgi:hypothetical protein
MKVQNKAEAAAIMAANESRAVQYAEVHEAWQAAADAFAADDTLLLPGPEPAAPTPDAPTLYDVTDVTEPETVESTWGFVLLLPGMKKLTAPDGTCVGVTAADFAASWETGE